MSIPVEIWKLIQEFSSPHLFHYLTFSQICGSARIGFMSSRAWEALNPYGVANPAVHFLQTYQQLTDRQRQNLYIVWTESPKYIVWATNIGELPALNQDENLYYKLGLMYSTAPMITNRSLHYQISDYHLMLCAVKLNVYNIYRAKPSLMTDPQLALEVVSRNGCMLELYQMPMPNIREVVLAAVRNRGTAIQWAPLELWEDMEIIMAAVASDQEVLEFAELTTVISTVSPKFKAIVLHAISHCDEFFAFASLPVFLQADRDIVLGVFHKYPRTLPHFRTIESALRLSPELAIEAVQIHGSALPLAPTTLRGDYEAVLAAAKTFGISIACADYELRNNREIALAAVTQDGRAFTSISPELQDDREIFLAAVATDGYPLEIKEQFRGDREVLKRAVANEPHSLEYASDAIQDDDRIVATAVAIEGKVLKYASQRLRNDPRTVKLAVCSEPAALKYASEELRDQANIVKLAVRIDGGSIEHASMRLKDDHQLVMTAVTSTGSAIVHASTRLQNDREIFLKAVETDSSLFRMRRTFDHDREIVLAALCHNGSLLSLAAQFQDDEWAVITAVISDSSALIYASPRLQKNERFILLASIATANPIYGKRNYII